MVTRSKIVLYLVIAFATLSILYLFAESFFPRDIPVAGSLDGKKNPLIIEKFEQDNRYYITFREPRRKKDKILKIECTKEQYDFIVNEKEYHMLCRKYFFNRSKGKILTLDDKPIIFNNMMW